MASTFIGRRRYLSRFFADRTAGDGAPLWWWIEWLSIAIWRPRWCAIVTIHLTWNAIGRLRTHVEELHDRGLIEPRSRRDRATIVNPTTWKRLHDLQTTSKVDRDQDQTTIVARSWPDRGLFLKRSQSNSPLIPGQSVAKLKPRSMPRESHPRRHQTASTTAPNDPRIRAKFPL